MNRHGTNAACSLDLAESVKVPDATDSKVTLICETHRSGSILPCPTAGNLESPPLNGRLLVVLLNQGAAHVVAAFRADRVRGHRGAALRAVRDLGFLDAVVAAAFTGTTVAVFSFWDSHGCRGGNSVR